MQANNIDPSNVRAVLVQPFQTAIAPGATVAGQTIPAADGSLHHFQLKLSAGLWEIRLFSRTGSASPQFGLQMFVPTPRTLQTTFSQRLSFYPLSDFALATLSHSDPHLDIRDATKAPSGTPQASMMTTY